MHVVLFTVLGGGILLYVILNPSYSLKTILHWSENIVYFQNPRPQRNKGRNASVEQTGEKNLNWTECSTQENPLNSYQYQNKSRRIQGKQLHFQREYKKSHPRQCVKCHWKNKLKRKHWALVASSHTQLLTDQSYFFMENRTWLYEEAKLVKPP